MKTEKSTKKKKMEPFEIGELDQYLFGQGNHYEIYQKMGAHKVVCKGKEGVYFAVWAPHARRVAVVGDFNGWDFEANYMDRQEPLGIYTCFVPGVQEGALYKCAGCTRGGYVQVLYRDAAGQTDLQGGSICKLCGTETGNRFPGDGYLQSEMDGQHMDEAPGDLGPQGEPDVHL